MLAELFAILLPPEQKEMGGEVRVSLVVGTLQRNLFVPKRISPFYF